jgi:hypothetical protein
LSGSYGSTMTINALCRINYLSEEDKGSAVSRPLVNVPSCFRRFQQDLRRLSLLAILGIAPIELGILYAQYVTSSDGEVAPKFCMEALSPNSEAR